MVHATYDYPGVPVVPGSVKRRHGVLDGIRIPLRPHFGVIAVAPREADFVDSVPPSYFGGNLDNWRLGKGSAVYLPVSVPGALLSVGDPHAAQGDGELGGTAIECSMTGTFQLILHKKADLAGPPFADLTYPLIETETDWVLTGFSHPNYLAEFGAKGQSEVYATSSLDLAMKDAFRKMRRFLMNIKGLSEDEAIALMSAAVDFGVTQVVDGNWGVHAILSKRLFETSRDRNRPRAHPLKFHMIAGGPRPVAPFSHAVETDGFVFVTGQMPDTPDAPGQLPDTIEAQTRAVMENLRLVLAGLDLGFEHVVMARIYLTRFRQDYAAMNETYRSYFAQDRLPARTCVGVTGLAYDALIEIDLICRRP